MANKTDTVTQPGLDTPEPREPWFAQDADRVVVAMETDAERGLSRSEAGARLSRYGPNQIAAEKSGTVKEIKLKARVDTEVEIDYLKNGGVLHYVLRNLAAA